MSEFVNAIVQFNKEILGIQQRPPHGMPKAEQDITLKCLVEEVTEFHTAMQHDKIIDQVDALIDLIYFAVGAMYKIGLTPEQIHACCMAVHNANMAKKKGVNAKRATGAADAVKPKNWVPPEHLISNIIFGSN